MKLPVPIEFDWDEGNKDKNWKKHKVHYKESEEIFFNRPIHIYKDNKHSGIEQRFTAFGKTNKNRLLYITFTIRNSTIRIISTRDQSKKERKLYEKK